MLASKLLQAALERELDALALRRAAAKYLTGEHGAGADVRREVGGQTFTVLELVGRTASGSASGPAGHQPATRGGGTGEHGPARLGMR